MSKDKFFGLLNMADESGNLTLSELEEWLVDLMPFVSSVPKIEKVTAAQNVKEWRCPQSARPGMLRLVNSICGGAVQKPPDRKRRGLFARLRR